MSEEELTEQELAERIIVGDGEALNRLYRNYGTPLLNLTRRILGDDDDAEDLVHDLFLALPRKLGQFRWESRLSTWLFRVATNEALTFLRKQKRRLSLLQRLMPPKERERDGETERDENGEVKELVDRLLQIYPPEIRTVLWMKEGEGLDIQTIAEIVGVPEGTIKSRLSRARGKGLRWLEEQGYGSVEETLS